MGSDRIDAAVASAAEALEQALVEEDGVARIRACAVVFTPDAAVVGHSSGAAQRVELEDGEVIELIPGPTVDLPPQKLVRKRHFRAPSLPPMPPKGVEIGGAAAGAARPPRGKPETMVHSARELSGLVSGMKVDDLPEKSDEDTLEVQLQPRPAGAEPRNPFERRRQGLKACRLFQHLTTPELDLIAEIAKELEVPEGAMLVTLELTIDRLLVVVAGQMVEAPRAGGPARTLEPGECHGAAAMVDFEIATSTVVAGPGLRLLAVAREHLLGVMRREPVIAVKLLWGIVQETNDQLRAAREAPR